MRIVALGEVTSTIMGQAPPGEECNKEGRGTIFVKAGEFDGRFPLVREWTTKPLRLAKSSDVLICVVGATAGKISQSFDCAIGRSVAAVRPTLDALSTEYLYHFLNTRISSLRSTSQGLAQGVITREMIGSIAIPVPALDEQRRIAAILDQADALRRKRSEALALVEGLQSGALRQLMGQTGSKGWPAMPLGTVADIASGLTKGRKLSGKASRRVPYLAVANVQDKRLDLRRIKLIEATDEEVTRYRLRRDDLLLTEGGDPDKLGRGTLWGEEIEECVHQNHIFRVRLTSREVHPVYLNWYVGGPRGKAYFLRSAKQTTGIASINMTQLRAFPLPLPPLPLQQAFAARVVEIDRLKAHHRAHLRKLDTLFASLQHRAFRGEL